jgi:cytochrome c peroxidase
MKRLLYIVIVLIFSAFVGKETLFEVPPNWPQPKYDFEKNPLSENKVLLGRALFYDPLLSKDNIISCASCHSPFSAFTHIDHALSHGIHDSIGTRNSPALMNLAWQNLFMWDGAVNNLDMQALAPLSHPSEMGSSIQELIQKLNASKLYKHLFLEAYGDSIATGETTLKAISQFMLTLVSANSKYDRVKSGKESFSVQELNGYQLFQQNCASCHKEPLFTTNEFANNGLEVDTLLNDFGRMKVTLNAEDSLKFKIPTLRNIEFSYPYMHDGRFKKLSQVLGHYINGIHQSSTLAPELKNGIQLTSNQKVDLISFLLTLSDKEFIFNSKNHYPQELFSSQTRD